MSTSARSFLDFVAQRGLLEDQVIQEFRAQVDQSLFEVPADAVAKLLVDKGHLTAFQAKKLLAELGTQSPSGGPTAPVAPAAPKPTAPKPTAPSARQVERPQSPAPATAPPSAVDSADLGLMDLGDGGPGGGAQKPAAAPKAPVPTLSKPAQGSAGKSTAASKPKGPSGKPATTSAPTPGLEPLSAASSAASSAGLTPLGNADLMPLDDLGAGLDAGLAGMSTLGDPFAAAGGLAPATTAPPGAAPATGFKKVHSKGWDSAKFLIVLGLVIAVIGATPFLWYVLTRETASQMFEAAESDYKGESYTQAIAKYDKYLKANPGDPNVSLARVRRGLAMIRSVVAGTKDARQGLARVTEVLPQITPEVRFADARPELAGILPTIAGDLAKQARDAGSGGRAKELVDLAEEAMKLVEEPNYIPTSLRNSVQGTIEEIKRTIGEAHRNIRQAEMLVSSLQQMQEALGKNQTAQAFALRHELLKEFPGLETNEQLVATVLKVATAEQSQVKVTEQTTAPSAEDHPQLADLRQVVLSNRRGDLIESAAGQVAFVLARGAVYGIDVASGKILWRRFVGFETFIHPQTLVKNQSTDALIADMLHLEIARLEAKSGQLLWRLPIGERFAPPTILGNRVFVTTATGRVIEADLETGKSSRVAQLPQGASVEVGVASQLPQAYQVGMHSNIYVLGADTLACKEVFYLGHKPGTIAVPPVAVLNHLFVAENAGSDYSLIHVVAMDESGLKLERPADQEVIRVAGNVISPLIHVKNRVLVTTDRSSLLVLEVDNSNKRKPVKTIASRTSSEAQPVPSHVLAEGAQLWIGNDRFVAFDIQASREQLAPKWVKHEQEWFVAPLQKFGPVLVHTRRRRGSQGATVSAARPDTGALIWQTDLSVPVTFVGPDADQNQAVVINAQGELFRLTKEAIDAGFLDKPIETGEVEGSATTLSFNEAFRLDEHRVALVSESDRGNILIFDPRRTGDELAVVKLDVAGAVVNTTPVGFGGGVAATTESGAVWWLAADTGKSLGLPYQPKLGPAEKIQWSRPAVLPNGRELVLSDGRGKIYRIAIQDQPMPHLLQAATANLSDPLVGALAAGAQAAIGWSRGASSDAVRVFPLPGLDGGQDFALKGRVLQGPWSSSTNTFLVGDMEGLLALAAAAQPVWESPLTLGPLAGPPRVEGKSILFATQSGAIVRLAADSGKVEGHQLLNQPLVGAPLPFGNRLLVPGADGVLYAAPAIP